MKPHTWTLLLLVLFTIQYKATAAVVATVTRGTGAADLDSMISTDDALSGLIATELPGDTGWHPANPASDNSLLPSGLPAFSDGQGELGSGLTGLLNDFPSPLGTPVKLIQYDLPAPLDIERIKILSGNRNNADGRIFSTTVIRYSTNSGQSYDELGYFESAPLGSINNETGIPGTTEDKSLLLDIADDLGADLATGVTNLQFDFYAVDNTQGQYRDPFDGVNPFTQIDDGLTAAIASPLIWEIDVLGEFGSSQSADFDGNSVVDGADFLIWQRNYGTVGAATPDQGDANLDQAVDAVDLGVWKDQFAGGAVLSAIPEPHSASLLGIGALAIWRRSPRFNRR